VVDRGARRDCRAMRRILETGPRPRKQESFLWADRFCFCDGPGPPSAAAVARMQRISRRPLAQSVKTIYTAICRLMKATILCTRCTPETLARRGPRNRNETRTPSWTAGSPFATPKPSWARVRSRAPSRCWCGRCRRGRLVSIASPRIAPLREAAAS